MHVNTRDKEQARKLKAALKREAKALRRRDKRKVESAL